MPSGVYRRVFLVGRYAVKVPHVRRGFRLFLAGLLCNLQEADFWEERWPQLCPVVWSGAGGLVIVMRRAIPLTEDEFAGLDYAAFVTRGDDYARANYESLPWGDAGRGVAPWCKEPSGLVIPAEDKADSFGWLDGRIVATDYGGTWF